VGFGRKRMGEKRRKREEVYKGICMGRSNVFPRKELIQSCITKVVLQLPRELE